jgi:hypothetical protein
VTLRLLILWLVVVLWVPATLADPKLRPGAGVEIGDGLPGANDVIETMLKVVDAAGDEECLTFESTVGDFEWQPCSAAASLIEDPDDASYNMGPHVDQRQGGAIARQTLDSVAAGGTAGRGIDFVRGIQVQNDELQLYGGTWLRIEDFYNNDLTGTGNNRVAMILQPVHNLDGINPVSGSGLYAGEVCPEADCDGTAYWGLDEVPDLNVELITPVAGITDDPGGGTLASLWYMLMDVTGTGQGAGAIPYAGGNGFTNNGGLYWDEATNQLQLLDGTTNQIYVDPNSASNGKMILNFAEPSGAVDATITFPTTTGVLITRTATETLTNKTLLTEGAGVNDIRVANKFWFAAAGCSATTASPMMDLPTSNAADAECVTETNTQKGVLDFDPDTDESAQFHMVLPSDWYSSGDLDVTLKWFATATSGEVIWAVQTACVGDGQTDDPAFNTASTVTDTVKGTTLQTNDASIAGVTKTDCDAGELIHFRISRDADPVDDDMNGDARLIGVQVTWRETK